MSERPRIDEATTRQYLSTLFEDHVHARRVWSLADGVLGVSFTACAGRTCTSTPRAST